MAQFIRFLSLARAAAWSTYNARIEWYDAELQKIDKSTCALGERCAIAEYTLKHRTI